MNHSFDVSHAQAYGVVEAILISNFQFWISKNKANGENLRNDRTWTYNSVKAYAALFPYLSHDQVRRAIDRLVKNGILVVGNYNERGMDQTKWFAFNDENLFLPHLAKLPDAVGTSASPVGKSAKSLIRTDVNTDVEPSSEKTKKASRITSAWKLPKHFGEWALDKYPDWTPEFIRERGEKFRDHWSAIPGKAGLKSDWLATWRNFCLSEFEFMARTTRTPAAGGAGAPWWSSDALIQSEAAKRGTSARPGETMYALRGRVQEIIDSAGKPADSAAAPNVPPVLVFAPVEPDSAETKAARSAMLRKAIAVTASKVMPQ